MQPILFCKANIPPMSCYGVFVTSCSCLPHVCMMIASLCTLSTVVLSVLVHISQSLSAVSSPNASSTTHQLYIICHLQVFALPYVQRHMQRFRAQEQSRCMRRSASLSMRLSGGGHPHLAGINTKCVEAVSQQVRWLFRAWHQ